MKSIEQIESQWTECVISGNTMPDETVEWFPGMKLVISCSEHERAFDVKVTLAGISAYATYHIGMNITLAEELKYLANNLREAIEEIGADRVRKDIKHILDI